ncbi:gamma carbonic anhydrase family protein [methane-oxidizing endosymbiont of Gigantopelta aegis]|uniref:gamma carbonic anhydrase family protein n=1 Tax=methane-oxidizing endosymbiont of Gigantopelta aegis TaxID=2794938 RepID=UPI0018DBB6D2|nr:gamma carbonic anhydrase family protein [methane-oxidizing endosymbiont of Gigantopelta aegis]
MTIRTFKNCEPKTGQRVFIDDSAVVIGDVHLADDVSVWPMAVLRGDVEKITVGEKTNIQDGAVLHVSHASEFTGGKSYPLTIGNSVTIGHKAVVHACTVGDFCLIGIGANILDGAVLEDYVMLGAGALVPPGKRLESGYLYVGAPARQARALTDEEKRFLDYSAVHYVSLKDEYLVMG